MVADNLNRSAVDAVLAQFPGPVRLSATKTMQKVILIGCLAFEFVLVKSLLTGQGVPALLVVLMLLVLCQILWSALVVFKRGALGLVLTSDGFTILYPLRSYTRTWKEVGDFKGATSRAPLFDMTFYNDRSSRKRLVEKLQSAIATLRFGRTSTLPDTYSLGSDRLAELMTAWHQRALSQPH